MQMCMKCNCIFISYYGIVNTVPILEKIYCLTSLEALIVCLAIENFDALNKISIPNRRWHA